jgi:hypothetical protein
MVKEYVNIHEIPIHERVYINTHANIYTLSTHNFSLKFIIFSYNSCMRFGQKFEFKTSVKTCLHNTEWAAVLVTETIHVAANCIVNTSLVKCPFPCRIANKDYLSVEDLQLFLEGEQGVRLLHSS